MAILIVCFFSSTIFRMNYISVTLTLSSLISEVQIGHIFEACGSVNIFEDNATVLLD